jgi:hypothetical protein
MKKSGLLLLALASLLLCPAWMAAGEEPEGSEGRKAIEQAVRDYIDGWYEGSAERMERALHPELAKRRVTTLPNGRAILDTVSADNMVEYTRLGGGSKSRQEGQQNQVIILDLSSHTASVKTISPEFIDYLHLAKMNGQWQIVNVLWEPVKP